MESRFLTIVTQIMVMSIVLVVVLLFIGITILIFLHICIVGRVLWSGRNSTSSGGTGNDELPGLSPEELGKLPCYDFDAGGGEGPTDCAVCLDSFQKGDRCRLLPMCRHSFHADYVDSWLTRTPLCPMCRTRAYQQKEEEEGVESGSVVIDFSVCS